MADSKKYPRGGHGGSVEIIGGSGIAEGGNGGRGGAPGYGRGGDGGGGTYFGFGACYIRGGDGGDAGRPARPALGAVSTMCYIDSSFLSLAGMINVYGIPQPGKGGDSYMAYVIHDGYRYCLNILLQLIRGPIPIVIDNPGIIDLIDELGVKAGIKTEQEWWDLAIEKFPKETSVAMAHMRASEAK